MNQNVKPKPNFSSAAVFFLLYSFAFLSSVIYNVVYGRYHQGNSYLIYCAVTFVLVLAISIMLFARARNIALFIVVILFIIAQAYEYFMALANGVANLEYVINSYNERLVVLFTFQILEALALLTANLFILLYTISILTPYAKGYTRGISKISALAGIFMILYFINDVVVTLVSFSYGGGGMYYTIYQGFRLFFELFGIIAYFTYGHWVTRAYGNYRVYLEKYGNVGASAGTVSGTAYVEVPSVEPENTYSSVEESPVEQQAPVQEFKFCENCGTKMASTSKFCPSCGKKQN